MSSAASNEWEHELGPLREALVVFFSANLRGDGAADDLANDVIVVLMKRRARGETFENLRMYAFGVAKKLRQAHIRGEQRTRLVDGIDLDSFEGGLEPPPSALDDPHDEQLEALRACLSQLGDRERSMVVDYYAEGKNAANRSQLAMRLGIGDGALNLRASRARKKLRVCVAQKLAAR